MIDELRDLWERSKRSLKSAEQISKDDPDSSVSRAYYSVFHAVTALFLLGGKEFTKHSALESAVHKELVKKGLWSKEEGADRG